MSLAIRLNTFVCPDGVELYEPEPGRYVARPRGAAGSLFGGDSPTPGELWMRPKSENRVVLEFSMDAANVIALNFAHVANDDEALVEFANAYGIPSEVDGAHQTRLSSIRREQIEFHKAAMLNSMRDTIPPLNWWRGGPKVTIGLVPTGRPGEPPKLGLTADNLISFMWSEIAVLLAGASTVRSCEHCGKLFAVGGDAGKRAKSVYCSNYCRTMAHRARKTAHA